MDILSNCHINLYNMVSLSILVYWDIYILDDASVNIYVQLYKQ